MDIVFAAVIFLVSYVFIMSDKVNRAVVALAGGVLLLLTGIYTAEEMFISHIDWNTVALLFSMMVLISITDKTGLFSYIAIRFAQHVRGSPVPLLVGASILTAVGSALLDNVTTVLIFVPIMLRVTRMLKLPAFPYLLAIIFSSNIGGSATLIGDPPNIMIGQAVEHLTFLSFIQHLAPLALVLFFVMLIFLQLHFRDLLKNGGGDTSELMKINAEAYLIKSPMLYQSIAVLIMTLSGFLLHSFLHIELTVVAISGAVLLLLLTEKELEAEHVFEKVEWVTLFFFIGLFMLVGGLEEVGLIDKMAETIVGSTEGNYSMTALLILWVSGLLSGIVDNIPFVAAMIPVVQEFEHYGMTNLDPIWWSLALGACLGGNATLIGASANVVVAGLAEGARQRIPFLQFMRYGVPFVLLSLVITTAYIYIRYLLPLTGQ
ncbi:ArsB/NhaD family transporter [Virgibacillus xinjiangensis]|uniref:ArsB/NhaD family transporter n=1 Tax=Virgibacillus xinjiangensis TaxID=393090 RepID=A0ABV7CSR3_9BACI